MILWKIFIIGVCGIVGAAGALLLTPIVAPLGLPGQLFSAGFLGSLLSSLLVKAPAKGMEKELGKGRGILSKLKIVFWFIVIVAVIYAAVFIFGSITSH